ncbi:ABC-type bacteriocin/lantibiotic exporter with double-glycine peptidase domain [Methanofollis sp. W23]|uniref:cysteine peptidase family C39 domain-containing protein n=1 Tax=Methanofollis sp. W23 TaxID=2817849 RepID=UPI001AE7753B|nr:cysteine peptidase family C39 domain-containing protein [Methanofollis sp. W23]MBP2146791.1 ABC-type bacteriocin/lantibiotic exporter with double-glycine peptidase domain [Methanofollis sp. W23]
MKSEATDPPRPLTARGKDTQTILLTIVFLIALTSVVIGIAVAYAFPELFLKNTPPVAEGLTGVPDVRQSDGEGSAAASFQAVMAYYGLDRGEQEWREAIGPVSGTEKTTASLATTAREEGFNAEVREGIGTEELTAMVMEGVPAIVPLEGEAYVVVVGVEEERIVFEDPAVFGGPTHLKTDEFMARWTGGTAVVITNTYPE